jgi:uncharacterized protein (TIGR03790 family)
MRIRGIPPKNLLELWVTDRESCSREDYERKVLTRVREFIKKNDPLRNIRCLLTVFGLPLKIAPPSMSRAEKEEVEKLKREQGALVVKIKALRPVEKNELARLRRESVELENRIRGLTKSDHRSSFDSELAMVMVEDYNLKGWIPNPLFIGFRDRKPPIGKGSVLMVSRLDGPTEEVVRRIMRDSLETEKQGLKGTAYFDARWPKRGEQKREKRKEKSGYGYYDGSIHLIAEKIQALGSMPVVVDDKPELFQPGDCPDAALYCGWYSLAKYVDAFEWKAGAVGYHIASSECTTLKQENSQVWCKRMLEEGVAATLGPVGEPYVQSFPVPEVFFGLLTDGRLALAECYMLSLPFL